MDEEQFILRLPEPLVEHMRFALSSTKRRDAAGEDKKASTFSTTFKDERNGFFTLDGVDYPAKLMDLPNLVESHKTADKRTFYKSADIHQVFLVRMPGQPAPEGTTLDHGLTPGAQHAGKRFIPQTKLFSTSQVESVERRVKMVIDHKVKLVPKSMVPKKDIPEQRPSAAGDEMEVVIEEDSAVVANGAQEQPAQPASASNVKASTAAPPVPLSVPLSAPLSAPAKAPVVPVAPSPAPSPDVHPSPMAATPSAATPGAATPLPEPEPEGDGEDDDDDDDFAAEMAGALMETNDEDAAQKRIERANLDQKVIDEKAKIAQLEARAAKAPNVVLRTRILSKRGDMQATLAKLEKERAELGDNF